MIFKSRKQRTVDTQGYSVEHKASGQEVKIGGPTSVAKIVQLASN